MRRAKSIPKIDTFSFGFYVGRGLQKPMAAAAQHNEIELNFVEQGEILFRRGKETVTLSPGTTTIYWAAVPHQVVAVKPKTEISWLVVPLAWFLAWKLPVEFTKRMLGGRMLFLENAKSKIRLPSVTSWAEDFGKHPDLRLAVKLEIEAFFRRLAVNTTRFAPSSKATDLFSEELRCRHVERMVSTITSRFREALSIKDIAASAGLNPEYAMRLFRDRWGMTLWSFLLQQRIAEARRLLLLTDASIVEIAFACGFQSLSRFYEAFKTQCQCRPGAYRRKHADGIHSGAV